MTTPAFSTKDSCAEVPAPSSLLSTAVEACASFYRYLSEECHSSATEVFLWMALDREKCFLLNT